MKISIRTYFSILFFILTSLLSGQSKNCGGVYTKGTPLVKCIISPLKIIQDTIIAFIPKNCNDILFDANANGHWKIFSSDTSTLIETVDFKNGKRNGLSVHYYANKIINSKINYVNGKLSGDEIIFSETGKVIEKGVYDKKEVFSGIVTQYWDNGNIASELTMKNLFNITKSKYWDKDGKIINEEEFNKLWYDCK